MAGLLGLDPTDPNLAVAAGLLGGHGNLFANLSQGLMGGVQMAQTMAQQERANRQNDLQQLAGLYATLNQQENIRFAQADEAHLPFTPNPMLGQIRQRMGELAGLGNLAGSAGAAGGAGASTMPQGAPLQGPTAALAAGAPQGLLGPQGGGSTATGSPVAPSGAGASGAPSSGGFFTPAMGMPASMYLMSDPTMKSYIEARVKQATPIPTRYGVYTVDPSNPSQVKLAGGMVPQGALPVQMGPQGPSIAPLPGQFATQEQSARASATGTEAGKFPGRVENVQNASGATVPTPLTTVFGGNPYDKSAPSSQPNSQPIPPQVLDAAKRGPFVATQAPGGPVNFQQGGDPFASVPKRYQPQGTGQTTFDRGMAENQAKSAMELSTKLGTQADAANQRIALNSQSLDLVGKADTGPMAARIGDVKNWLVSRFGVPEDHFANTPSADLALQKDLVNAATQRAKQQFGSRITQSEVNLMLSRGAPNVDMTKAAITYLLQSDNAMLGYQIKQANDFGQYLQRGGDPMRFEAWYARSFPQSAAVGAVKLDTSGNGQSNVDALVNKYRTR